MSATWYEALGVLGVLLSVGGLLGSLRERARSKARRGQPRRLADPTQPTPRTPSQWRDAAERSRARSRERR